MLYCLIYLLSVYLYRLKQLNISNNPINALPLSTRKRTQPSHQHTASHQLIELRACNCSLTSESIDIIVR